MAQGQTPAADMRKAAAAWLEAAGDMKSKVLLSAEDSNRETWNYVPMKRSGVALAEMDERQKVLAHDLLRTALSQSGFLRATTIVSLELVLRKIEQRDYRDPGQYYLTIFGSPASEKMWGWRFEGHHLSLNFTLVGDKISVAPSFFGSNPASHTNAGQHIRPLASEEDLARTLVKSLNPVQRKAAVFSETAPREIITETRRKVQRLEPAGINYAALDEAQKARLQELVSVYVNRYRTELAKEDLGRVAAAGWENVSFAWAGGFEKGQGHYYRVQGPTFLLEYDNTQNRANHIHTVWRDLERDFGGDLLGEHYHNSEHHRH